MLKNIETASAGAITIMGSYLFSHDFYMVLFFILMASISGCFLSSTIDNMYKFFIRFFGWSLAGVVFLLVALKEKGEEFAIYATIIAFVLAMSPDLIKKIIEKKL